MPTPTNVNQPIMVISKAVRQMILNGAAATTNIYFDLF